MPLPAARPLLCHLLTRIRHICTSTMVIDLCWLLSSRDCHISSNFSSTGSRSCKGEHLRNLCRCCHAAAEPGEGDAGSVALAPGHIRQNRHQRTRQRVRGG